MRAKEEEREREMNISKKDGCKTEQRFNYNTSVGNKQ